MKADEASYFTEDLDDDKLAKLVSDDTVVALCS
jgi:hypothetical protein